MSDTLSLTKTYMTFILAFVAIIMMFVSPSSITVPQPTLTVARSASLDR